MNNWFRRNGWNNHANGVSRINVLCEAGTGRIAGYVALSASQIERGFLAKSMQRNKPDPIPAILLGQLAVDKDFQGQGHAAALMNFALKSALHASQSIGASGVITHPLDDSLRSFYARWGFANMPGDPRQAMLVRMPELHKIYGDI